MSEDDYYEAVSAIGLRKGQFETTWFTVNGSPVSVPLARDLSPEARADTIEGLKQALSDLLQAKLEH